MTTEEHDTEPSLRELVQTLTTAVNTLSDRFRRKRVSDAILAAVVAVMLVSGCWYFFVELPNRRAAIQNDIHGLACYAVRLRPPGYSQTTDDLRRQYHCPPFDPSLVPDTTAPGRTTAPSTTAPARRSPAASRPSARPTAVPGAPSSASRSISRRTAAVAPPRRTATRPAPARTPLATAPSSRPTPGVIPSLLCTLLGCPPPRTETP